MPMNMTRAHCAAITSAIYTQKYTDTCRIIGNKEKKSTFYRYILLIQTYYTCLKSFQHHTVIKVLFCCSPHIHTIQEWRKTNTPSSFADKTLPMPRIHLSVLLLTDTTDRVLEPHVSMTFSNIYVTRMPITGHFECCQKCLKLRFCSEI